MGGHKTCLEKCIQRPARGLNRGFQCVGNLYRRRSADLKEDSGYPLSGTTREFHNIIVA